jgi:hypothetical protein
MAIHRNSPQSDPVSCTAYSTKAVLHHEHDGFVIYREHLLTKNYFITDQE